MHHQWKQYKRFGADSGDKGAPNGGNGGSGMLLSGGKFRLKDSTHGSGVGSLGLMGAAQVSILPVATSVPGCQASRNTMVVYVDGVWQSLGPAGVMRLRWGTCCSANCQMRGSVRRLQWTSTRATRRDTTAMLQRWHLCRATATAKAAGRGATAAAATHTKRRTAATTPTPRQGKTAPTPAAIAIAIAAAAAAVATGDATRGVATGALEVATGGTAVMMGIVATSEALIGTERGTLMMTGMQHSIEAERRVTMAGSAGALTSVRSEIETGIEVLAGVMITTERGRSTEVESLLLMTEIGTGSVRTCIGAGTGDGRLLLCVRTSDFLCVVCAAHVAEDERQIKVAADLHGFSCSCLVRFGTCTCRGRQR